MDSEEILAFLDSLELDEEIIDTQLSKLVARNTFTDRHMRDVIRFIKYKLAVSKNELLEGTNNSSEYELVIKLIKDINHSNIDRVCEITNLVLQLDPQSIVSRSEHLLQQILSGIELPTKQIVCEIGDDSTEETPRVLLDLKLCSSILKAVISQQQKVLLPFLQEPLENIVFSPHDRVVTFFFVNTIPDFHYGVNGYHILSRLWLCLKNAKEFHLLTLKALSSLADYYLPVEESGRHNKNSIATDPVFWQTVLFGLQSTDITTRKRAIYLIKRALESLMCGQESINITIDELVMVWDKKNERALKAMWDNFFILIDSLEEMQSNIVLPSLKLFESLKDLGHCWQICAYNIGLKHDNAVVRLNCINHRLYRKVNNTAEALVILNALNDINLFENAVDSRLLTRHIAMALNDTQSLINIMESIPSIKWCPVPLYYLTETLGHTAHPTLLQREGPKKVCSLINDILRIPCNSPVIKKAIYANISSFTVNSCKEFLWEDYLSIYTQLHSETPITACIMTPFASHIKKNLEILDSDKEAFAEVMVTSCENISIGLLYVSAHDDGMPLFLKVINDKTENIANICSNEKSRKAQCLADVNFLLHVFGRTNGRSEQYMVTINSEVAKHTNVILQYMASLLDDHITIEVDDLITLFDGLNCMSCDMNHRESLFQLYNSSVALLKDRDTPMETKTLAIFMVKYLASNNLLDLNHCNEMLNLELFLSIIKSISMDRNIGSGKLKNAFYEKTCEIVVTFLKAEPNDNVVIKLFEFLEDCTDCGGYGCLKHILHIVNIVLPKLIAIVTFNLSLFLTQMWSQICELKTNKEYVICVDEFVKLITEDILLRQPEHNRVVVKHYHNIIELASCKKMPLYFLVKHLSRRNVLVYENMVNVLCNILLYAVVPKKDHRITENLTVELYQKVKDISSPHSSVFSQHIQLISIAMLHQADATRLNELTDRMISEIDDLLKIKPRYYANNTTHRKMFRALQSLLFLFLSNRAVDSRRIADWCIRLLKCPHDGTVRTCMVWYIALYIYWSKTPLNSDALDALTLTELPLLCQFTILYNVMRHKVLVASYTGEECEFVLDLLMSHTMGPVFSVRLAAQYYAMTLYESIKDKIDSIHRYKYTSAISTLSKTLGELETLGDNTFANLRKDYFTKQFDIVSDLTLEFVFHGLQRHSEQCNENVDVPFAMRVFEEIEGQWRPETDAFYVEWKSMRRRHEFSQYQGGSTPEAVQQAEEANTIQKKYVPWRNMTDMDIDKLRRNESTSPNDVIMVASLVDRPPNLGGLARTCEVFGVRAYVLAGLRLARDRVFQSLSVSADRWLDMREVPPGALREYLVLQKRAGYAVVAAEQTSTSRPLTRFKFPKKCLILLGHEKEGIPPNILPLMDHCVEIPQRGVTRSLNVHVTASIFLWEYVRQRSVPPAGRPTVNGDA